jgi:hypothetical protein
MNSAQRKFLVEKIQEKVKARIKDLESQKQEFPSASNYIFKAILNNELKLQPEKQVLESIKQKALAAKEGANWLSEERLGLNKENTIRLNLNSLIILPDDYKNEYERVERHNKAIKDTIQGLKQQLESIEVRVQLASDKTLQKLINEVDDMGSLSLVETKLKHLPQ